MFGRRMIEFAALASITGCIFAQTAARTSAGRKAGSPPRMTVEDVVRLARAGIADEIILAQIHNKRQAFDLTADQLVELKSASVSDRVIRAMMNFSAGTAQAPAAVSTPLAASHQPKAANSPAPAIATTAWVPYRDPMGFAVSLPAGWHLRPDKPQGRVTIDGTGGQLAVVWPMFVERQQLDAPGAGILVQQLARRADAAVAWGAPELGASTARVLARGQRSGAAVMRWNAAPEGATVFLFCVTAPSSIYKASLDTFARILQSFQVLPGQTAGNPASPAKSAPPVSQVTWVRWTDPREGAFGASVPRGWSVSGGSLRQSATDIRKSVVLLSPDGQIRITAGDANIGGFAVPNAMYARVGLGPGRSTALGDGTKLEIRAFEPARQFLGGYLARTVARDCAAPHVLSNDERPDLAAAANAQARGQGRQSQVTTAGVSFACTWNGREAHGYYAAATVLVSSRQSQIWYVDSLYGYVAVAERQKEADSISRHFSESMQVNSQWQQRESEIAGNAVQQDNIRSQEIQARARQAIAADQQQTSDMIVKGYQARSQAYDEIARRRENSILGTVDVVDPSSGKQYKIDNYSDYHWMNNSGVIAGTKTDTSPGYDWRQMIDLP